MTSAPNPIEPSTTQPDVTDEFQSAEFESAALVGNPRRTRGLHVSMLDAPEPVSTLVGNPRRLRRLDPAAFTVA
jgi:hypothetical protein